MNVRELIKNLTRFPQDAQVLVLDKTNGDYSPVTDLDSQTNNTTKQKEVLINTHDE